MKEYYWPHPMAKETSLSQAGRFLPYAKTTTGDKAAMLVNKLTALSLLIFLPPAPAPCADPV